MSRHRFARESYYPKGSHKISDKQSSAVVYVKATDSGGYHAVAFRGNAQKPDWNVLIRKPGNLEKNIAAHFESVRAGEARRVADREKRKAFAHSVKAGDIYKTCWGYDQTNVEFFEIVEVKGKYAILREIASASRDDGHGSEKCVPQSGAFLEPRYKGDDQGLPLRRLIQEHGIKIDNVRTASPWGKRGAAGIVIGEACHRTAAGWGH